MAITRRRKAARKLRGVKKKRGRHTYKKEMDRPTQGFGLGLGFRFGFAHMCCQTQGCQAKLSAWAYTIYVYVGYTLLRTCLRKGAAIVQWGRGTFGRRSRDARVSCQKQRQWRQTQSAKKCCPNYQSETFVKQREDDIMQIIYTDKLKEEVPARNHHHHQHHCSHVCVLAMVMEQQIKEQNSQPTLDTFISNVVTATE